jgi:GrpB-like predicted nucleotidyltransferase (UPF0157 family)
MDQVRLRPFSRRWKWLFLKEKLFLTLVCGRFTDIQHVGSTAIPSMVAKPIIDIFVAVSNYEQGFALVVPIERLGYEYKGENSELRHYYYVKGKPEAYHLSVVELDSYTWARRVAFRNYLIRHREAARRYAELKRRLAHQFAHDLRAYQDGKNDFIDQIVKQALPMLESQVCRERKY